MKRSFYQSLFGIVFLSLLGTATISAQYVPLVVEGNQWSNRLQSFLDIDLDQWFEGDSLIEGLIYKRLYTQVNGQNQSIVEGLIHEDVAEQKVYAWTSEGQALIYDFDVVVGQTVSVYVYGCTVDLVVTEVTTTMLGGDEREMIVFENEYWVEGMGSIYTLQGAGYYNCIADIDPILLCFFEQGELKFSNPDFFTDCETVVVEELSLELSAYPNPTTSQILVNGKFGETASFKITDAAGRLVKSSVWNEAGSVLVDMTRLESGYYFLQILDKKNVGVIRISKN